MRLAIATAAAAAATAAAAAAACGPRPVPAIRPLPPVSAGKVSVRVFTEPAAVRAVVALGPTTLVATDNGLERWDGGRATILPDLEGHRVSLLAADATGVGAWVVADGALGHYDLGAASYAPLADDIADPAAAGTPATTTTTVSASPSAATATATAAVTAIAAAGDDGVWIGGPHGLTYASRAPHAAAPPLLRDAVRALVRTPDDTLYAATAVGLVARRANGELVRFGAPQGCPLVDVRLVVEAPGSRVAAFGVDDAGHDRIAIGDIRGFTTFRALPDIHVDRAARRGAGVFVLAGDHAYRIAAGDGAVRPLAREGTRLVPIATPDPAPAAQLDADGSAAIEPGETAPQPQALPQPAPAPQSTWSIDPVDLVLPAGETVIAGSATTDDLFVGTRDLGVARFRDGDRHARDWLRARAMFADATALSVACTREQDCWIATGARVGWHWTGGQFTAFAPEGATVLAVVRDPAASGAVYAIEREAAEPSALRVAVVDGRGADVAVRTGERAGTLEPEPAAGSDAARAADSDAPAPAADRASRDAELVFARFASPGVLWLGLRHPDAATADAPLEIVAVELATGTVTEHMSGATPAHVADVDLRGGTAWFATAEGVVRATGDRVTSWTERDGLRSELVRAVSISPAGNPAGGVAIGTRDGVGLFDGHAWAFPAALRFEVNDLVAARTGLWLATERGLVAWDGKNLRRFDTLRGLAENEVLDVAADSFGRIWARGPTSLTLLAP